MRNWLATAAVALSLGMSANSASAQQGAGVPAVPSPSTTGTAPQAPIGHRQPMARDVPPDLASPTDGAAPSTRVPTPNRRGGGPPTLQVGQSCEAAGQGSVVLGRDKKACLGVRQIAPRAGIGKSYLGLYCATTSRDEFQAFR
jgi:hypothetical protein